MYTKSLKKLSDTLEIYNYEFQIEKHENINLKIIPCKNMANDIFTYGYPSNFSLNTNSNGFRFYGLNDILKRQDGYNFKLDEYLVIADSGSDPIVVSSNCYILWSIHGLGKWEFKKISKNISYFFSMLEVFSKEYFGTLNGNIFDDDFNVIDNKYELLKKSILNIEEDSYIVNNFLSCILYL